MIEIVNCPREPPPRHGGAEDDVERHCNIPSKHDSFGSHLLGRGILMSRMATFDKYSRETHELVEMKVGRGMANATFFLIFAATWATALGVLYGFGALVVFPLVNRLPTVRGSQLTNVAISLVVTTAVAGGVAAWVRRTFEQTRSAMVSATESRICELAQVLGEMVERVRYLESHAASVAAVNKPLEHLHERLVSIESPPAGLKTQEQLSRWALIKLLDAPSAHSVGHPLQIHAATYGIDGGPQIDVKLLLEKNIEDNRLQMKITNETMGRDPLRGHPKQLRLRYAYGEHVRELTLNEDDEMKIPE